MKKLVTLIFVVLTAFAFAGNVQNINGEKANQKGWIDYSGGPAWIWSEPGERAMYYDVEDFGMEYPIDFYAVQALMYENGVPFHFKIYDKDGTSVLWESADSLSAQGYWQMTEVLTPVVLADDFWIAITGSTPADPIPNTVVDAGDGPLGCHSYYGTPGSWVSIEGYDGYGEEGMAYNHSMLIYAEPSAAIDVFPPLVREVSGTTVFMDVDMDIAIRVTDQNGLVTPVPAEYSFDGGSSWTPIDFNTAKESFNLTATIPGQVDGTTGVIRFNVADTLGNAAVSDEYEISWSKDNPMLYESFEGATFPPDGWTLNTSGAGWIQFAKDATFANVRTGSYCASHQDDSGAQDSWLISPAIDIPATDAVTLSFWQTSLWHDYLTFHEVAVSADGGTTWDQIYVDDTPYPGSDVQDYLTQEMFSLGAYAGQTVMIGWHYMGDFSDQWYIDDVELLYDYVGPDIVDIEGNTALLPTIGAYLNNDLELSVTAYDLTGVKSITGHYSYDGGTTWNDVVFAAAKGGNEVWTGTIPAEAAAISGIINFDLVDLGDIASPTTMDYNFEFVVDEDGPVYKYVMGTEVTMGDPMDLTIVFTDESAITSCSGAYSKDGWVTQYDFEMTPSKVHEYSYVGTIPAEAAEVLDGEVIFTMGDAAGNFTQSPIENVQWRDRQIEFWEDFEGTPDPSTRWYFGGNWGVVEEDEYISATHALTESPGGNYASDESTVASLLTGMDWTTYFGAKMSFWCAYDIEAGFDYMYFDVTKDNGLTWTNLQVWDGEGVDWHEEKISLDAFVGTDGFNFRFRWVSDGAYEVNGMYIDDIQIVTYNTDVAPPLTVHAPYEPEFYEGTLGDYTNNVDALDISGVAAVEVVWSVDDVPQTNIAASFVAGEQWEFTIPAQEPGAVIKYQFWSQDASTNSNETTQDKIYTIVAGDHQIYDDGFVSYYNTTEDGDAKAIRFTVPGTDVDNTYRAQLAYLLIRNYADISGHLSDDMTVRVWQDDGTGVPGVEAIAPIDVTPEANTLVNTSAMTMIDLRALALDVYGDFWVGFSSEYGIVYSTQTATDETGTPDYGRSFDGIANGDGTWTWGAVAQTNYHFRAVLGAASGIEGDNTPLTTALEQNYPNPFNPMTTINFTIADEAKVSLVVYDVMGREVARLVDGNLAKGVHNVNFDASSLVSGVYYYNLKAGNVNQTKKMMLIK